MRTLKKIIKSMLDPQKQLSRVILRNIYSENMKQITGEQIALRHGCSPVNLLRIFRKPFLKNTSGKLLQDPDIEIIVTGRLLSGELLMFVKISLASLLRPA